MWPTQDQGVIVSSKLQRNYIYGFRGTGSIINKETWLKRFRGDVRKRESNKAQFSRDSSLSEECTTKL
jgi:hypothetical protein